MAHFTHSQAHFNSISVFCIDSAFKWFCNKRKPQFPFRIICGSSIYNHLHSVNAAWHKHFEQGTEATEIKYCNALNNKNACKWGKRYQTYASEPKSLNFFFRLFFFFFLKLWSRKISKGCKRSFSGIFFTQFKNTILMP